MTNPNRSTRFNAAGVPEHRGLYNPAYEHDSCGVGFVATLYAEPSHSIVEKGIRILVNLEHRGAIGGDKSTGDGAGILTRIPDTFFRLAGLSFSLPQRGDYAVGMAFLPSDPKLAEQCARTFERIAREEGHPVLGWRNVPHNETILGDLSRSTKPGIAQCFLDRGAAGTDA
ncbi:MAG: glutamate synthase subunit alpha, partial [Deltaproteobacteria bacterium]|nr:glutamate synthase subunit alpha [Deltaproteobacteria bacterium]